MSIENKQQSEPWFRNPMVWMVIFFPSLAVVSGIITIIIAIYTDDGLVVDDYYKQGLAINQVITHDKKAKQLGLRAFVDLNSENGEIRLSLSSNSGFEPTPEITFRLIHRTRSGLDQTTVLSRVGNSLDYRGYFKPPLIEGRWTIQVLATGEWRLKQNFTSKSAEHILMNITG